jgi:hypothetical protein
MENFPEIYRSRLRTKDGPLRPSFDPDSAFTGYDEAVTAQATEGPA